MTSRSNWDRFEPMSHVGLASIQPRRRVSLFPLLHFFLLSLFGFFFLHFAAFPFFCGSLSAVFSTSFPFVFFIFAFPYCSRFFHFFSFFAVFIVLIFSFPHFSIFFFILSHLSLSVFPFSPPIFFICFSLFLSLPLRLSPRAPLTALRIAVPPSFFSSHFFFVEGVHMRQCACVHAHCAWIRRQNSHVLIARHLLDPSEE